MKRWFICRTYVDPIEGRMPKVHQYTGAHREWIHPTLDLAAGQCAVQQLGPVQSDQDIALFPDQMLLDFQWNSFGNGIRTAMMQRALRLGFETSGVGPSHTNHEVLSYFARQMDPNTDVAIGDVFDPWG